MIKNVIEYFESTIIECPNKIAVIDGDRKVPFSRLANMALSIGTAIHNKNNQLKKTPIAVFLPKSVESIIADIGIIYSGNAYMNLDVKNPSQRIGNILDLVRPAFVVTNKNLVTQLSTVIDEEKILLIEDNYSIFLSYSLKIKIILIPINFIST